MRFSKAAAESLFPKNVALLADTAGNDGANSGLREKRRDLDILMSGDVVVITDERPRVERRRAGARDEFKRKGV